MLPFNGQFFGHSENDHGQGVAEPLYIHIQRVADRAYDLARPLGLARDARMAGLLHDLGKYARRFQARLCGQGASFDHASPGALAALQLYGSAGHAVALAIRGHHLGIENACAPSTDLAREVANSVSGGQSGTAQAEVAAMLQHFVNDGLKLPSPREFESGVTLSVGLQEAAAQMLDLRMLFSALVDADFLETESHFAGDRQTPRRPRPPGPVFDAARALDRVVQAIGEKRREARASEALLRLRNTLLEDCLVAAELPPGLFTLNAPTGAGKTLAMLAFAIKHAMRNQLRRVVMVIPYLTIIEQTSRVCHGLFDVLDPRFVLEDHSAAAGDGTEGDDAVNAIARQRRLLAENYDAPLVLTTSVQALESLHARDPRRCRKLNRLANSVILFDEVQTLPPHLATITLATLSWLARRYGSTVLFSTATQPAFESLDGQGQIEALSAGGWKPREIVRRPDELFTAVRDRYAVNWRYGVPTSWDQLADELVKEARSGPVLVIVNVKKHALALVKRLGAMRRRPPLLHLSTNLCPLHRERVLDEVNTRLHDHQPLILVATQCIEAGVDVSFSTVYRALAPLEAIAQAAGRCNRHGTDPKPGRVVVFMPEEEAYPPGAYEVAAKTTRAFLRELGPDIDSRTILTDCAVLRRYYRRLYETVHIQDSKKSDQLLTALEGRDFPEVARLYRLIEQDTVNVLVPFDRAVFDQLIAEIESEGRLSRGWVQRARRQMVSLRRPRPDEHETWAALRPLPFGCAEHETDWFVLQEQSPGDLYDAEMMGLKELRGSWIA